MPLGSLAMSLEAHTQRFDHVLGYILFTVRQRTINCCLNCKPHGRSKKKKYGYFCWTIPVLKVVGGFFSSQFCFSARNHNPILYKLAISNVVV